MGAKLFQKKTDVYKMSHSILHNKFVLYFIFALAVGNLFQFVMLNNLLAAIVFILVGLLTSFFSKNMVVIMVVSMVVANIFKFGTNIRLEGFENEEEKKEEKEEETTGKKEKKTKEPFEEGNNWAVEDDDEDDKDKKRKRREEFENEEYDD